MGVKGLKNFIAHYTSKALQLHKLSKCRVLIDGNNLLYYLYKQRTDANVAFGGDYDAYVQEIETFFSALEQCSIESCVIMDGGISLRQSSMQHAIRTFKSKTLACFSISPQNPDVDGQVTPPLLVSTFVSAVQRHGVTVLQADDIADDELITLSLTLGLPVLSCDTDFSLRGVPVISLSTLNYRHVRDRAGFLYCHRFNSGLFCELLDISPSHLLFLDALGSRDHVTNFCLDGFIRNISRGMCRDAEWSPRLYRMNMVKRWLSQNKTKTVPELVDMVVAELPRYRKRHSQLRLVLLRLVQVSPYSSRLLPWFSGGPQDHPCGHAAFTSACIPAAAGDDVRSDIGALVAKREARRNRATVHVNMLQDMRAVMDGKCPHGDTANCFAGGMPVPGWFAVCQKQYTLQFEAAEIFVKKQLFTAPAVEKLNRKSVYLICLPIVNVLLAISEKTFREYEKLYLKEQLKFIEADGSAETKMLVETVTTQIMEQQVNYIQYDKALRKLLKKKRKDNAHILPQPKYRTDWIMPKNKKRVKKIVQEKTVEALSETCDQEDHTDATLIDGGQVQPSESKSSCDEPSNAARASPSADENILSSDGEVDFDVETANKRSVQEYLDWFKNATVFHVTKAQSTADVTSNDDERSENETLASEIRFSNENSIQVPTQNVNTRTSEANENNLDVSYISDDDSCSSIGEEELSKMPTGDIFDRVNASWEDSEFFQCNSETAVGRTSSDFPTDNFLSLNDERDSVAFEDDDADVVLEEDSDQETSNLQPETVCCLNSLNDGNVLTVSHSTVVEDLQTVTPTTDDHDVQLLLLEFKALEQEQRQAALFENESHDSDVKVNPGGSSSGIVVNQCMQEDFVQKQTSSDVEPVQNQLCTSISVHDKLLCTDVKQCNVEKMIDDSQQVTDFENEEKARCESSVRQPTEEENLDRKISINGAVNFDNKNCKPDEVVDGSSNFKAFGKRTKTTQWKSFKGYKPRHRLSNDKPKVQRRNKPAPSYQHHHENSTELSFFSEKDIESPIQDNDEFQIVVDSDCTIKLVVLKSDFPAVVQTQLKKAFETARHKCRGAIKKTLEMQRDSSQEENEERRQGLALKLNDSLINEMRPHLENQCEFQLTTELQQSYDADYKHRALKKDAAKLNVDKIMSYYERPLKLYIRKSFLRTPYVLKIQNEMLLSKVPSLLSLMNKGVLERKALVCNLLGDALNSYNCLPNEMQLLLLCICYWYRNSTMRINHCHVYTLLLCVLTFFYIYPNLGKDRSDEKLKFLIEQDNEAEMMQRKALHELKKLSPSSKIAVLTKQLDKRSCALAAVNLAGFSQVNPKTVGGKTKQRFVHCMSEFQACFLYVGALNSFMGSPFPYPSIDQVLNCTFAYNTFRQLIVKKNHGIVLVNLLGNRSHLVYLLDALHKFVANIVNLPMVLDLFPKKIEKVNENGEITTEFVRKHNLREKLKKEQSRIEKANILHEVDVLTKEFEQMDMRKAKKSINQLNKQNNRKSADLCQTEKSRKKR